MHGRVSGWIGSVLWGAFGAVVAVVIVSGQPRSAVGGVVVSVVTDRSPGPGASHGLKKIAAALEARGIKTQRADSVASAQGEIVIVAGLATGSGPAAELVAARNVSVPDAAEALAIRHIKLKGKPALLIAGADDRGLMYAELDVADRIGWAADRGEPLSEVRNAVEKPYMPERSLSIYTMHQKTFERFFFDESYWADYLDMLARNRFNTFALLFGYENWGYFSPPYPYRHFPTTRGWVERQRQEDLPVYAKSLPSDTQQFLGPAEAAKNILEGIDSAKILPRESSAWFARASADVLESVEQAEKQIGEHRNKEFNSTMVDLRMLAHLAMYHSWRAKAGVSWALYDRCHDLGALGAAIRHETEATGAWAKMVEAAGDVYHDDLMMGRRGSDLSGHWRDELVKLKAGLEKLQQERKNYRPTVPKEKPWIAHVPRRRAMPGKELLLRATVNGRDPIARVRVGYRLADGETVYVDAQRVGKFLYRAAIPADKVTAGLSYFIEAIDDADRVATWPADGPQAPIAVAVTDDHRPPTVTHEPIAGAPAQEPLNVSAVVQDPAGVKWVRLRYRSVCQFQDYQTLEMTPVGGGQYEAVVPGEQIVSQWDFMYLIEVMDNHGNGQIYPNLEKEMPYIVVHLQR